VSEAGKPGGSGIAAGAVSPLAAARPRAHRAPVMARYWWTVKGTVTLVSSKSSLRTVIRSCHWPVKVNVTPLAW
jgi:hypothetical protein